MWRCIGSLIATDNREGGCSEVTVCLGSTMMQSSVEASTAAERTSKHCEAFWEVDMIPIGAMNILVGYGSGWKSIKEHLQVKCQ